MLVLRKDQLDAFDTEAAARFRAELASHLRTHFAERFRGLSDDDLNAYVSHGIKRAQAYGIGVERAIALFVHRMAEHGDDFDTDPRRPWVARILNDDRIPGDHKMNEILLIETEQRVYGD
jgi:hypothetical protein